MKLRMIRISEIRPNPFQPRESFPKDEIQELANSIKKNGLLQPISVRKSGETYQIISGERRWRACQFAGLNEIPVIVKDVSDSQLMIESLVENVQRTDLEPIEKARGLAEVYRLAGFEPARTMSALTTLERYTRERLERELKEGEVRIKEIADMVGLSYDYQYRLLSQLRLSREEQLRVTALRLGYEKISSISSIENKIDRKKVIEMAPNLERAKVKKITKIVRKAPKRLKEAVLEREVDAEVAEEIMQIEEHEKQEEALSLAKKGIYTPEGIRTRMEHFRLQIPARMENEIEVGEVECPECGVALRLIHIEPRNKHRVEEKPS